jgi:chromosomal replication initiator protein
MTSDVAPKNLPAIEARLISRFEGGMLQEIESPSYETRLAILKKKAQSLEVRVPDSVLEFISDNIKSHVRAMEGALGKVSVYFSAYPTASLNNDLLAHLLSDFIQKEQTLKKLNIEEIQAAVAKKFSVSISQMLSTERTQ